MSVHATTGQYLRRFYAMDEPGNEQKAAYFLKSGLINWFLMIISNNGLPDSEFPEI